MRFRIIALEAFALFVSYLVFSLTLVSATDVNIMYNGIVQDTTKYEHDKLVNMNVVMKHEPGDITWTNVKLTVNLNSASLSHSIKKILLYKCRSATPTECVRSTPQSFDNYVDSELLWKDVSEKTGSAQYPQAGNLLFLVKFEDTAKKESWAGFFIQVKRTNYNIFDVKQLSLGSMDLYAKSLDLVQPIKTYIEDKFMIPFKWATKVVFNNARPLYGMGANSQEVESNNLQTAVVSVNEITSINKDFYFIAPNISSGIASPITLNLNPSFTCGSGACESDIGESMSSCCYDCGCPTGQFCDVPANINLSSCKNDSSSLSVISVSTPSITECSGSFSANISVQVSSPPASLGSQVQGTVTLNNTVYSTQCTGGSSSYMCSISIASQIKCGGGSYAIGPGLLNLTLSYKDGQNTVTKALSTSFSGVNVNYDCKCQDGSYCDLSKKSCQSESAITLGITRLTSYLESYNPGDRINLTAKIFNPPAGLTLVHASADMNLTNGQVSPGTPDCSPPTAQYEYTCLIPFQITGYSKENAYTFQPNTLHFDITYPDGPLAKTKTISAPFGPVSIPAQYCGNSKVDSGETEANCCMDVACSGSNKYCDKGANACRDLSAITLSVNSVYPSNFTDCRQSHTTYISVIVNNAPTDLVLDYQAYLQAGVEKGWNFQCQKSGLNLFNCTLVIPPLEAEGCSLPYKVIGQNSINMSISFPDGKSKQVTKTLSAPFSDIHIIPVYHCGDGTCESDIGENPSVCCYDCPCKASPSFGDDYYCSFDPATHLGGCLPKQNITLIIDSPKAPVNFDTCELTNSLNIQAHIVNQPTNAMPTLNYATINGTSSQSVYCSTNQLGQSGANLTFNCTLSLPRIYKCTQGQTYTFDPNSFSTLISYQNGAQQTETQTLSASLPTITIHQGIRTLYDITQEGIDKLKSKLSDTMNTARDLFDAIKSCMETVKMLAYLTLMLTVAGGIYGWTSTTPIATPTPIGQSGQLLMPGKLSNAVAGANLGNLIGNNLMTAYTKMCDYLQSLYQIDLKIQQIEMQMIQADMCMQMQQHLMDIGNCNGNEQGCFSQMVSCVSTYAQVDSWAQSLSTMVTNANSKLTGMTTILGTTATTVGGATGIGSVSGYYGDYLYTQCGSTNTDECCTAAPSVSWQGTTACVAQQARLKLQPVNCGYLAVASRTTYPTSSNYAWFCAGNCDNAAIPYPTSDKIVMEFKPYCFANVDAARMFGVNPGSPVSGQVEGYCAKDNGGICVFKTFTYFLYKQGQAAGCICPGMKTTGQTQPSENLEITNVQQQNQQGSSVMITWTTNLAANSEVDYGLLAPTEKRKIDSNYATGHSMVLNAITDEIQCGSVYFFKVLSATQAGTSKESAGGSFSIAC
jgi:hypothetical protein